MNYRKFFSRTGMSYFVLAIVTMILAQAVSAAISHFAPQIYGTDLMTYVIALGPLYLVGFPLCAVMMKKLPKMRILQGSLRAGRWIALLCICLFIMLAGNLMGNALVNIISNLTGMEMSFDLQELMLEENLLYSFLFSVVLAPVLEEVMFRKVLIDRVIVFGDRTAIFLSGFLFGLFHGNFYQVFYAFGLGCLFAYIYIRTGRLRYTISLHMTINFLGGFVPLLFLRHIDLDLLTSAQSLQDPEVLRFIYDHLGVLAGYGVFEIGLFILGLIGLFRLVTALKALDLRPGEYSAPARVMAKRIFGNAGIWLFIGVCILMFAGTMTA